MNVIVLTNDETFIQFLDTEELQIDETEEKNGLRTIEVTYLIEDLPTTKELFKKGNKLFITNDEVLDDCLYVINESVTEDYFKENHVKFTAEEVLVELNYAPLFSQTELTSDNGFTTGTTNGEAWVKVNYNALLYWFGNFFNIGIVQDCISTQVSKIKVSGTVNRMNLLRIIEEETNNVFVTRYELDIQTNKIHRYLDFLNPLSANKNWVCNFEYDYIEADTKGTAYDENDEPFDEDAINYEIEDEDDRVIFPPFVPKSPLNPDHTQFRITNSKGELLNTKGEVYELDGEQVPLAWSAYEVHFGEEDVDVVISLSYKNNNLGIAINNKTYTVSSEDTDTGTDSRGFITVENDPETRDNTILPNHSWFEIYDMYNETAVYRHELNPILGDVHEDIIELGYNSENITYKVDESDTFSAISPILSLSNDTTSDLTRTDMHNLINRWKNLSVAKGATIPMIVEKVTLTQAQKQNIGTYSVSSNYYTRPFHPQDNIDTQTPANSTYEYLRATAYWSAPFTKRSGNLHIENDTDTGAEYVNIRSRNDFGNERSYFVAPKMGTVETSDEDIYAIYNDVVMKLKDKRDPSLNLVVDVANYQNGKLNTYKVWDKVYCKVPGFSHLISARVKKTTKNPYDIGKNTLELGTYSINTKVAQTETILLAGNVNMKYPAKSQLVATLTDELDNKLQNKLVSFAVYSVKDETTKNYKKTYNKKTNAQGQAILPLALVPGNWEITCSFGGDIAYTSSSITVKVNVTGTVQKTETKPTTTNTKKVTATAKKTTAKTTAKKSQDKVVIKNYYYDKFGRSPDLKYVCAIGLPSRSSELRRYGYKYLKTVFVNKCPVCGRNTLYWGWHFGTYFRGRREGGSAEGHVFCEHCDSDFSTIYGENHTSSGRPKLRTYQAPRWSSKNEAQTLKNGKLLYKTEKIVIKPKKVTSNKNRKIIGNPSAYIRRLALNLAGDSQGWAAAKKIAAWFGANIRYGSYPDFHKGPDAVVKGRRGNCCDQTRAMLTTMDAAGCTEFLTLKYVHVCCSGSGMGHVFARVINKRDGGWSYVDPCKAQPWANYVKGWGRPPGRQTNYPNRPF